ncbi:MAG TPA: HEPN domain-containing protein [bacterium]|nr:HEPN domain-containing protein [bacterium]
MKDLEYAQTMLTQANKDFKALLNMLDETLFEPEIFGFHAQQTIEKALKAWLSFLGVVCPKTHDLEMLFALLEDNKVPIPDQFRSLTDFTDFAVQFRYEAFTDFSDDDFDRQNIVSTIGAFIQYVKEQTGG